ncbi:major facilitator superfamily domain-containing protein [Mycena vulgaris]|nr:major facilitator superfamily domain-containing protein [Mycena vulgaris]
MFLARIVFFRLHKSPRFLVHAGRPEEALETLQLIARFNGAPSLAGELELADVDDTVTLRAMRRSLAARRASRTGRTGGPRACGWCWCRSRAARWCWCGLRDATWRSVPYTMFNVFLPKLLENTGTKSIEDSLWDVLIFTLGGCPGALLGAKLILTPLGRCLSLAGSTLVTAAFGILFVFAQSSESVWAVRISAIGVGLASTLSANPSWTPEIVATKVRGTACGITLSLSRIGGMIAPMLGGALLLFSRTAPVYTSMVAFVLAAGCVLLLSEDEGEGGRSRGGCPVRVVVH